jgi:hypothetical protein
MRTEVKILCWLARPTQRVFVIVLWENQHIIPWAKEKYG